MVTKHTSISLPNDILIGKDILELVTSAMYVDPLTIYREYVQNAADSIDEARALNLYGNEIGQVEIHIDAENRNVRIRDNGTGVPNGEFAKRLTSLGASRKRGTAARGFRGVGRLAGLGYCQSLIFRSRSKGDANVQELVWDCKAFKKLVTDSHFDGGVGELIKAVATVSVLESDGWPEHFYEVELVKPIRIKNDLLLNEDEIGRYLSQVAPVPFNPKFKYGKKIAAFLREHTALDEIQILLGKKKTPLYRPYLNEFSVGDAKTDEFTDPEFRVLPGMNGGVSAVAWMVNHSYLGAIPSASGVKGLKARKGNIQVGDHRIFTSIFPEARFASWIVGEVHLLDDRVVPNGRRDDFEQNAHYTQVIHQLTEIGDHVARLCRSNSIVRNRIKAFDIGVLKIEERLNILEQGVLRKNEADAIVQEIQGEMHEIRKVADAQVLCEEDRSLLAERHQELESRLKKAKKVTSEAGPLAELPKKERETIQRMISLIYECSVNRVAAKTLVDRIMARI
ncbi:ATP-binding protein [Mesoterricola silvestris]|uniref:Molecular chaperone HtpG n=1 Tax=Mesoterricola silvestris TaxID=2927979 RepID=A0AA48K807_9BACT|nr:ATP-binding protein [Mesoterricola silvestris]BDU70852.1 hypothetical protein METEAL_00260 [Mesoterricola silvestris]